MEQAAKGFNKRAFISTGLCAAMLFLPASGYMNHQLQAEALTVGRHFWMSVHNMTSLLFSIFLVLHVTYNWRSLLRYLKSVQPLRFSKEGVAAVAMVVVIVGVFASHVFHVR